MDEANLTRSSQKEKGMNDYEIESIDFLYKLLETSDIGLLMNGGRLKNEMD
jgi:hypothetical protein